MLPGGRVLGAWRGLLAGITPAGVTKGSLLFSFMILVYIMGQHGDGRTNASDIDYRQTVTKEK
jgi:hypothetical protein